MYWLDEPALTPPSCMDNDIKHITVVIAGRSYPLKVKNHEEAAVRSTVKDINDNLNNLKNRYTQCDFQDCLVMTLLTCKMATLPTNPTSPNDVNPIIEQIQNTLNNALNP